jgi:hypothetical protein
VEGFRLFTSAARALLRYRRVLSDCATYGAIGAPLALDDHLDHATPQAALSLAASFGGDWQTPLRALASRPANTVKWLTKREWLKLLNYLGGPHPDDEDEDTAAERQERAEGDRGLAGSERFDLSFVRTLMRADVFGAAQANIVARLRRSVPPAAAVADAMAPLTDEAYDGCAASYGAVRDQLRLEVLVALAALMEQGALEALALIGYLAGRDAVDSLLVRAGVGVSAPLHSGAVTAADPPPQPDLDDDRRGSIAQVLRSALRTRDGAADGAVSDLVAEVLAAVPRVNRVGFRREDRTNPATLAALRASVRAVVDVLTELDRLIAVLPRAAGPKATSDDRPRFEAAFRDIYAAA